MCLIPRWVSAWYLICCFVLACFPHCKHSQQSDVFLIKASRFSSKPFKIKKVLKLFKLREGVKVGSRRSLLHFLCLKWSNSSRNAKKNCSPFWPPLTSPQSLWKFSKHFDFFKVEKSFFQSCSEWCQKLRKNMLHFLRRGWGGGSKSVNIRYVSYGIFNFLVQCMDYICSMTVKRQLFRQGLFLLKIWMGATLFLFDPFAPRQIFPFSWFFRWFCSSSSSSAAAPTSTPASLSGHLTSII